MVDEREGSAVVVNAPVNSKFSKTPSLDSQATHVLQEKVEPPGHGQSALPEDKDLEALEDLEQDWESDPANARNWPAGKKWLAVSIVSSSPVIITLGLTSTSRFHFTHSHRHWHPL
jgi:hypothetical protein